MLAEETLRYFAGFGDDRLLSWDVLIAHQNASINDDRVDAAAT